MNVTSQEIAGILRIVAATGDVIRHAGEIPSGHLYSEVCGKLTLSEFTGVIEMLKRAGLVSESNHLLKWIGPR